MPSRCDTGQQSFCQATVFPAMVMVVGCEENLTEARMSSHASALLNTRGCSHSSEWKKLRGRVMYPFSIFADYRHFADSERKNREKGGGMPWHFRIDVRVKYGVRFANSDRWFSPQATEKRECPFGAEILQIKKNYTNQKKKRFERFEQICSIYFPSLREQ